MNTLDKQYQDLLQYILEYGVSKEDRTGTGTISTFGRQIRHNLNDGFPLLTTKKMAIKSIMTELKWFLKGDTNIKYLVDNGCNIWNGDSYKNYCKLQVPHDHFETEEEFIELIKTNDEFANKWGELGPIYGHQWRDWTVESGYENQWVDQIKVLINNLKDNPDNRRLMVSAWNVGDLHLMTLPPCHYGFQVYTRELNLDERIDYYNKGKISKSSDYFHEHLDDMGVPKRAISLMWNQRSVDTFLGLPFNIASYAMLLCLLGKEVNMVPDELIGNLGDVHLYKNHIEQAKEQITRKPMTLPVVEISELDLLKGSVDLELKNYIHHSPIKAPLSN